MADRRETRPAGGARSPRGRLAEIGEEPDARYSFANERTFLAWNRTALGCVVAGLAVTHVLAPDDHGAWTTVSGVMLIVLGLVLALVSYANWYAAERAMRLRLPLPHSPLLIIVSIVTAVVAAIAAIASL